MPKNPPKHKYPPISKCQSNKKISAVSDNNSSPASYYALYNSNPISHGYPDYSHHHDDKYYYCNDDSNDHDHDYLRLILEFSCLCMIVDACLGCISLV